MKRKKRMLTILAVLLIIVTVAGSYAYKEYNRKNKLLAGATPAFALATDDLLTAFTLNEKEATVKFQNKILKLSGTIKQLEKDVEGSYTLVMGDTSIASSVRCSMDSTFGVRNQLRRGDSITILGVCTGYNADELGLGADVILNRCVLAAR